MVVNDCIMNNLRLLVGFFCLGLISQSYDVIVAAARSTGYASRESGFLLQCSKRAPQSLFHALVLLICEIFRGIRMPYATAKT